jgi:hypothetical protein
MMTDEQEKTGDGAEAQDSVTARIKDNLPKTLLLKDIVGEPPAPGQPAAYIPPTMPLRTESRALIHDRALADIARLRFGFPTEKYPDYKTYVNHPARAMGIEMEGGLVAYPDIVVVQHPENFAKIVAEVETNETVREAVARWEWLPYADLAPLYLYVPVGKGDEALALCRQLDIPVVGIRTWRYIAGYDEPEISDHYTVASGPEDLLPRALRGG